jgi:indole-3-glycerol phosphate synthase
MHNILKEIVENKMIENKEKEIFSIKTLPVKSLQHNDTTIFSDAINKNNTSIIAEIKMASPSAGNFLDILSVKDRAKLYKKAGADAISVVTDKKYFGGDLDFIKQVKAVVDLPLLQKDFIIDKVQIEESAYVGADALLLIARILDKKTLQRFVKLCKDYGIEPVVEVYDVYDINKAIESGTKIIAVNARDLDSFQINIDRSIKLIKQIAAGYTILGFSGIFSKQDMVKYRAVGVNAVLVGTVLMQSPKPDEVIRILR